jgi:hypothetical protein
MITPSIVRTVGVKTPRKVPSFLSAVEVVDIDVWMLKEQIGCWLPAGKLAV